MLIILLIYINLSFSKTEFLKFTLQKNHEIEIKF